MEKDKDFELEKILRSQSFEREQAVWDRQTLGLEQAFEARKVFASQVQELRLKMLRAVNAWGQLCLRAGLILNGGAIVAVLTLIGATSRNGATQYFIPDQFGPALAWYSLGLLITCVAMFFAYANWSYNSQIFPHVLELANNMTHPSNEWPGDWLDEKLKLRIRRTMKWCIIFGVLSYISFLVGCIFIASVFGMKPNSLFWEAVAAIRTGTEWAWASLWKLWS